MPKWIRDTPMEALKFLLLQDLGEQVSGVVVRTDEDEAHLLETVSPDMWAAHVLTASLA